MTRQEKILTGINLSQWIVGLIFLLWGVYHLFGFYWMMIVGGSYLVLDSMVYMRQID